MFPETTIRPYISPMELRVMIELHAGFSPLQISIKLGRTLPSIYMITRMVRLKLGLANRTELVLWVERNQPEILKVLAVQNAKELKCLA